MRYLVLLLAVCVPSYAQVTLPDEVKVAKGRMKAIRIETEAPRIEWVWFPYDGIDLIPFPDGKTIIVSGPEDCIVELFAFSAKGDVPLKSNKCTIVIGSGKPKPPTPPTPPDNPDIPLDGLAKILYDAYITAPDKEMLEKLTAFHSGVSRLIDDPDVKRTWNLNDLILKTARDVLPPKRLDPVRQAIAEYLRKELAPLVDEDLDSNIRAKWKKEHKYVAECLLRVATKSRSR